MTYLIGYHWAWMAGALVVGLGMGWISQAQSRPQGGARPLIVAALILGLAIIVALTRILPGRAGYALDLGVLMTVIFLIGCLVGSRLRRLLAPVPPLDDQV